jgi:hypothetical protein
VGFLWVSGGILAGLRGFRLCSACFVGFVVLKLGNCAEMAVYRVVLGVLQSLLAVTFAVFWLKVVFDVFVPKE